MVVNVAPLNTFARFEVSVREFHRPHQCSVSPEHMGDSFKGTRMLRGHVWNGAMIRCERVSSVSVGIWRPPHLLRTAASTAPRQVSHAGGVS